ncbi:MAG: hypothetical protein OIF51_10735 [Cellvibrionaceae bacterium]|nr:hypothetical protein [Cellvibrionaceae bacterium]
MKGFCVVLLALAVFSSAHSTELEEVLVTAQSNSGDYYEMPAVTIRKKADFLVQRIRLINDSRSPDLRKSEILETIDNLIKASKRVNGIELSYGDGFLVPIKLNDDSLQLIEDRKKSDTSYVNIIVKVALNEKQSPKQQIAELRKFISKAKLVSRTEIELLGDIGLSIVGPEQYRYEILEKVAFESKKVKELLGGTCEMKVAGLEGRVEWDRSGMAELTLYIRYATEVSCK